MPSPGSYSLQALRGGARGHVTLAAVVTALFVIALVIVGAPLDGQLRFRRIPSTRFPAMGR